VRDCVYARNRQEKSKLFEPAAPSSRGPWPGGGSCCHAAAAAGAAAAGTAAGVAAAAAAAAAAGGGGGGVGGARPLPVPAPGVASQGRAPVPATEQR